MKKIMFSLMLLCVCVGLFAQDKKMYKTTSKLADGEKVKAAYGLISYPISFRNVLLALQHNKYSPRNMYMVGFCYEVGIATRCTISCDIYLTRYGLTCREHGMEDGDYQDYELAYEWYMKAVKLGYSDAMNKLGEFYRNGISVDQDYSQSYYWYKKAAEGGNYNAQYYLGEYYEQGLGVAQNSNEAFNWYMKAAKKNSDAQYKIGVCYDEGIGVAQDSSKAIKWWKKAAKNGNYFAQKALEEHGKK